MSDLSQQSVLKQYWNYDRFRPLQEDIIKSVLEANPTLALLPTGGGKSICFQVPGMCMEGICIVISPLIALMKDQVEQLKKRSIPAEAIYSGMSIREQDIILDNCVYGQVKFLYVSPERLKSELFLERSKKMQISLIAIDEAHCISQWGYDFRPTYLDIREYINTIDNPRIIALTATATKDVKEDILEKLEIQDAQVFMKSFSRKNLSYSVFNIHDKNAKLLEILTNVPGSSIIYVRKRKSTREVAEMLWRQNINADFYHAGLEADVRAEKQDKWIAGDIRVIVSTNAFGMGIDKPDVRTVIHLDIPDTLEAYYQEAGRAGRDEKMAYAVLLYNENNISDLKRRISYSSVSPELIKRVYQAISNHLKVAVGSHNLASFEIDFLELIKLFSLPPNETYYAIKKLEEEGLIRLNESFKQFSSVHILLSKEELYRFQVANEYLDPVIKGLLRLYGGEIFQSFLRVKENELATIVGISEEEVKSKLKYLHQLEVIDYDFPSSKTKLTYLTPRQDANKLTIDLKLLEKRNQLAIDKMESVLGFIHNVSRCRTQQLQEYFDEISYVNCGVCDYCISEKKKKEVGIHVTELKESIMNTEVDNSIHISELEKLVPQKDRFAFAEALRELMEEGKLTLKVDKVIFHQ